MYDQEVARETIAQPTDDSVQGEHLPRFAVHQFPGVASSSHIDVLSLAQAFQDSIALNILPVLEP